MTLDALDAIDALALLEGFTIYPVVGVPADRLYVHQETAAALWWVQLEVGATVTVAQLLFGRVMFLGGMAWGAGDDVEFRRYLTAHARRFGGTMRGFTARAMLEQLKAAKRADPTFAAAFRNAEAEEAACQAETLRRLQATDEGATVVPIAPETPMLTRSAKIRRQVLKLEK